MTLRPRLSNTLIGLSIAAAITAAGCGGISKSDADAQPADAGASTDAGGDGGVAATRRGSIYLGELHVHDVGIGFSLKGIEHDTHFVDLSAPSSTPVLGDDTVGGCTVWHHPAEWERGQMLVDEGDVSYSGTALVGAPPATCGLEANAYTCMVTEVENQTGSAINTGGSIPGFTLRVPGVDFAGAPFLGCPGLDFEVAGFATPGNNGRFFVSQCGTVDADEAYLQRIYTTGATQTETAVSGLSIKVTSAGPYLNSKDFLSPDPLAPGQLTIEKTRGPTLPSLATSIVPAGQGFALDPAQDQVGGMPSTSRDITFRCAEGSCTPSTGEALELFSITGYTTTESSYEMFDTSTMKPSLPGTTWAEFECHFIRGTTATIPAAVWAKVLETNPKRIETTVSYTSAKIFIDDGNRTMIRVGHGHRGYTTFAP